MACIWKGVNSSHRIWAETNTRNAEDRPTFSSAPASGCLAALYHHDTEIRNPLPFDIPTSWAFPSIWPWSLSPAWPFSWCNFHLSSSFCHLFLPVSCAASRISWFQLVTSFSCSKPCVCRTKSMLVQGLPDLASMHFQPLSRAYSCPHPCCFLCQKCFFTSSPLPASLIILRGFYLVASQIFLDLLWSE